MIGELRGRPLLAGYRGKPAGDLEALAQAIVALSRLADDPTVAEAEINPLIVRPAGQGVVAVDALVKLDRRCLTAGTAAVAYLVPRSKYNRPSIREEPMSHAEALQTLHPAAGATEAIVAFVSGLRHGALPEEVAPLCAAPSARHRRA